MLPLSAGFQVARDDLPTEGVISVDEHLPGPHVNHRFDGENHAWNKNHTLLALSEMAHLGVLMELTSHAMPREVPDHAIAMLVGIRLNGTPDIVHVTPGTRRLDAHLKALAGDLDEALLVGRRLTGMP